MRTPACSISATARRSASRSRATTTRPRSSPSRAPRPASAGSCATSSRWARGRSPCSTGCASGPATHASTAPSPGSAPTATRSAFPTVGGEAVFDEAYRDNVLVNAMCVGLLPADRIARAGATGPGNLVVLYGATTGRDGIGGASVLASQELGEDDADKRPTVQVGDPFMGKKLIEVSVELVESGLVESLQDCGAAGLASSLSEMARECGIDLRLDHVPLREEGMEPWEVMISESQERMVAVVRPQMLEHVLAVCERWELHNAVIGEVTDTGLLRALWDDEVVGEIPARLLTDECPRYTVEPKPRAEPSNSLLQVRSTRRRTPEALVELLGGDNVRSRAHVYRRYDHLVGSRTVRRPGLDAAVLRLRPGYRGLAVSLDGTGRMGRLDPRTGGRLAVLEAARNVACTGAEPIGLTDCLNFGNPEKGAIAWELVESIEGMAEACEALGIPIVSGNVSLYNETDGRAIDPTPVVGCVGLLEDVRPRAGRLARGRRRPARRRLAGRARRLRVPGPLRRGRRPAGAPRPRGRGGARSSSSGVRRRGCSLVHDVSLGGLAVALAKAALHSGIGAEVSLPDDPRAWFGEGGGQAVLACAPGDVDRLGGVPIRRLGIVGGDRSARPRRSTSCGRPTADVRRLRHPLGRARRGAALLLRPLRAPAPRPGGGGDRGLRPRPADRAPRHGPRRPGVRRGEAAGAPGGRRDRAHPLLDDRLERLGERAAARASRPLPHGRDRPQRQPDQHDGAAGRARRRRDRARRHLRHRGDRGADRERPRADRGSGRAGDAAARGRLLGRRALGGEAARLPRPAGDPAARARPAGRRLGRRVRDVRLRPDRRRLRARGPSRRARRDRRGGRPRDPGGPGGAAGALHLRARLLRAAGLDARRRRGARRARPHGRAARRRRRRWRPTS